MADGIPQRFSPGVSHRLQEGFMNQSEEIHRNKDQPVLVLKSNRIKLQEVLRRVGVPRDKKFRHNVQVVYRR